MDRGGRGAPKLMLILHLSLQQTVSIDLLGSVDVAAPVRACTYVPSYRAITVKDDIVIVNDKNRTTFS